MLRLEVLPARHGDCLLIEYEHRGDVRRILIDGGAPGVYKTALRPRLARLSKSELEFELLVVTHIDQDHIGGILELSLDDRMPFRAKDVWFNGFRHLQGPGVMAGKHGEKLTDLLCRNGASWNRIGFDGLAVAVSASGVPLRVELDESIALTVLSPTLQQLADLRKDWRTSCKDISLRPEDLEDARRRGRYQTLSLTSTLDETEVPPPDVTALLRAPFHEDASAANGSSIAFLLEYQDRRRILCTGDAHPSTLVESMGHLRPEQLQLDACKLPHHGSRGSVSADLISKIASDAFIFSSNGEKFSHPHPEAVARVVKHGAGEPTLCFNYRTRFTTPWSRCGYRVAFPECDQGGLVLELEP
ncbi:MAG TPA: MBL fold metallo-hydrolase [Actinomycetes bacterium]|jgi:beta-lactamase superfamily II metal-dependent hydrolase|nr:MBL fold metallo-hydrolase [Actinomycetes bacterium]